MTYNLAVKTFHSLLAKTAYCGLYAEEEGILISTKADVAKSVIVSINKSLRGQKWAKQNWFVGVLKLWFYWWQTPMLIFFSYTQLRGCIVWTLEVDSQISLRVYYWNFSVSRRYKPVLRKRFNSTDEEKK